MIDETWYQRPPNVPEHISAGGVVTRVEDGCVYIALVQEGRLTDYILPKGRVEKGETLEQAAAREIAEEAGLTQLHLLGSLGIRERLDFRKRAWKKTHYFLFATEQIEGQPSDDQHEYRVHWHPLDTLPKLFWPEQAALIEENRERIRELVQGWVSD